MDEAIRSRHASSGSRPSRPVNTSPCTPKGRFIPAHAGNTCSPRPAASPAPVHPRACGEHVLQSETKMNPAGSSPRMRGTQNATAGAAPVWRFIPAHAGNTPPTRPCRPANPVHPRACGEHDFATEVDGHVLGSSPRMRGTHQARSRRRRTGRFIPAHAGNTFCSPRAGGTSPVHPRACGEHGPAMAWISCIRGSSPRMRGTRFLHSKNSGTFRFIPAHAGNTVLCSP